jgi:hypothetical protein
VAIAGIVLLDTRRASPGERAGAMRLDGLVVRRERDSHRISRFSKRFL